MTGRTVSLGGLLLLFVASRLLYISLLHPDYLLTNPTEELYRGTIAQELVTGLKLPFLDYRADNYSGGSLVVGALASCFFRLFGPTLFALKLAPLLLFTLALAFWFLTLQRHVSERVALYFAVMFCFSPLLFTTYSVTAMGFHSESIFFSALTVFLLFRMLSEEKPSPAYPVLLGLTAGVGLWFAYIYGLTLLAMLGFWLWHDKGARWRWRVLWFALGFLVGFSPWIILNLQTHFAGLSLHGTNVWEHFGLEHLWEGLAHPRKLALYEFFANIASDDPRDFPRRAVNLLYSLLFLGPILTAGVLGLKTGRSAPAGASYRGRGPREMRPSRTHPSRLTLVGFGILYVIVLAMAVQFSDFRNARYYVPAYPFLFFFLASALARLETAFPLARHRIQTGFLTSVILLWVVTHMSLFSLDAAGSAFSAKGYSYGSLPESYLCREEVWPCANWIVPQLEQPGLLSSLLPKLPAEDQRELSLELAAFLAEAAPLYQRAGEFSRIERLVPPGFDKHFYYCLGITAMSQHRNQLPKAVAAVDFLQDRSAASHHLALLGIYRVWPQFAALDVQPASLTSAPATVPHEVKPFYWRALGYYAGRYSYDRNRSLEQLHAHLQAFVPRLDPSVQRYFLQGVGQFLFSQWTFRPIFALSFAPSEMERFAPAYQQALFEGAGMELSEFELFSWIYWRPDKNTRWNAYTKGLSETSVSYIREGGKQFLAIFQGPDGAPLWGAKRTQNSS